MPNVLRRRRLQVRLAPDLYRAAAECAALLLVQGVPARVVMETLGHSNISITMDTYTHVLPELQRQAADAMDRALGDRTVER